jgi:hypothetical protein
MLLACRGNRDSCEIRKKALTSELGQMNSRFNARPFMLLPPLFCISEEAGAEIDQRALYLRQAALRTRP